MTDVRAGGLDPLCLHLLHLVADGECRFRAGARPGTTSSHGGPGRVVHVGHEHIDRPSPGGRLARTAACEHIRVTPAATPTPGAPPPSLTPFANAGATAAIACTRTPARQHLARVAERLGGCSGVACTRWPTLFDPEFERSATPKCEKLRACVRPGSAPRTVAHFRHRALTGRRMVRVDAYACGGCV
jgi:hypothetical protein